MVYVYIYAFDFRNSNNFTLEKKIQGKLKRNKYKTRIKTLNCLLLKSRSLILAFYWNKYVLVVNLVVSVECGILGTRIPIKKTLGRLP